MLETTADRNAIREDADIERNIYGRREPQNFGLRYGGTGTYDYYARPDVASRYAPPEPMPPLRDDAAMPSLHQVPPADDARIEELWRKLNSNAIPRSAIENRFGPARVEGAGWDEQVRIPKMPARFRYPAQTPKQNKKLSTQGKVILAVYLAVILLIVTLVIVNAEMINTPAAQPDVGAKIEYVDMNDGHSVIDGAAAVVRTSAGMIPGMRS